jgi:hypothetical protein
VVGIGGLGIQDHQLVHNNLRSAASDHNTPEISGRRHTGTTLKAHEQEHERVSAHAAWGVFLSIADGAMGSPCDGGCSLRVVSGVLVAGPAGLVSVGRC